MQGIEKLPEQLQPTVTRYWQRLTEHPEFESGSGATLLNEDASFRDELIKVLLASDFAANAILAQPELLSLIHRRRQETEQDYDARLHEALAPLKPQQFDADALKRSLRLFHRPEFLLILWRDICELVDVHEVCRQMSALADACLQEALNLLHHFSSEEWGRPTANGIDQSLVVIGMGKLGARELNVSSDIDLIFAYPSAGEVAAVRPGTQPLTNQQYFTRLGQRLIDVIETTTADGFLFRVDMRLRPYGSEGALVASFDGLEDYYQNQGRDWERYALIKARIVAGDSQQGRLLLKRLKPFVYRRYLDFAMFESLRNMKSQINKQARRGKLADDIKLGQGGIREIEFVVQALQLVYGGRDRSLRQPSLTVTLENLVAGEYLPQDAADDLKSCYEFLRNLEHRLQAFANQQTQTLPADALQQQRIAFAMGESQWQSLIDRLADIRRKVAEHFFDVLHSAEEVEQTRHHGDEWAPLWKLELSEEDALEDFREAGFEDPEQSLELIREFRRDRKFLTLAAESRERLNVFMPVLLDAVSASSKPSLCLSRVMLLVEAVSRRTAYLVLLLENPQALEQLVQYCTASPLISEYLSKFPVLLDELLSVLDQPPDKSTLSDELRLQLLRIEEDNFEEELECLRYFKQSHLLQVAAAEVSGKMHLMKVSDYLTFTAEVILDSVLSLSWQHLTARHGYPVHTDGRYGEPDFAIVGYGKLGGLELSYNSDLDLVFLHRAALDEDTVAGEGQSAINSRAFYIKLAQRMILMLGTYTMSGKLYEADMRLRPSGESGLLVSSADSFLEYQTGQAWTWEHQALVRARSVAGSMALQERFVEIRSQILSLARDRNELGSDVVSMREKMRRELKQSSSSPMDKLAFEIKQGRGGIVDIEFMVQYLVLAHASDNPELLTYTDNFRILEAASGCQLLDEEDMQTLIEAYLELRAASHRIALQQIDDLQAADDLSTRREAVTAIWGRMFAHLGED